MHRATPMTVEVATLKQMIKKGIPSFNKNKFCNLLPKMDMYKRFILFIWQTIQDEIRGGELTLQIVKHFLRNKKNWFKN